MNLNYDWLTVYGNKAYRGDCPKEDAELVTFFNILRRDYPDLSERAFHVENEGKKNFAQVTQSKIKGQLSGVSDIIIIDTPSFVCEMKRRDHTKSTWQSGQLPFLESCHKAGAFVCVALGYDAAMEAVHDWYFGDH